MSNGFLLAAGPDLAAAHELAEGFGLTVLDSRAAGDPAALGEQLAQANNVGLLLSAAAANDERFIAQLRALALRLVTAQLLFADNQTRASFPYLPAAWPAMSIEEARHRIARRREASQPPPQDAPRAAPMPPQAAAPAPEPLDDVSAPEAADSYGGNADELSANAPDLDGASEQAREEAAAAPQTSAPPTAAKRSAPPLGAAAPPPPAESAPADATAFAPKKLRRGTPELVRIVIHQPKDLRDVIKAARKLDPRTDAAPQSIGIGEIALGEKVGVSLEVRGAACDGALQRRTWTGEAIDFSFAVEAEDDAKQAVILARVFVGEAQIGVLAFARKISGPAKAPAATGDVRMTRHKRVFLSYSSADRETVSVIATAYERAGIPHFWDRASLKSGEEWSPRLRKEIERADLFHLCWSKAAAQSEWVEKEATHALERRKRGKRPEITVQMLDGPPWAPHPPHLDSINFDDFVRAAIVGYARGDGS